MKKQHTLALLLMAGLMLGSCSSDDNTAAEEPAQPNKEVKTYHATTVAKMGEDGTRTLSLVGNTLNVGWDADERVYVLDENGDELGYLQPTVIDGAAATLEGTLQGSISAGDVVTLRFTGERNNSNKDYTAQEGMIEYLAQYSDYAELETTVESVSGSNITIAGGTLVSQQAIVKLTFTDGTNPINVNDWEITLTASTITEDVTFSFSGDSEMEDNGIAYVALPIASSGATTLYFDAYDDWATYYTGSKAISVSMENGKYYTATIPLTRTSTESLRSTKVGDVIASDGYAYASTAYIPSGESAVALVFYTGENGETSTQYNNGLAIALTDASASLCYWQLSQEDVSEITNYGITFMSSNHLCDLNGISNTAILADKYGDSYAGGIAQNYSVDTPSGTSDWFLPTASQWYLFIKYCIGANQEPAFYNSKITSTTPTWSTLNSKLTSVGGTALKEDNFYYSSTETSNTYCIGLYPMSGEYSDNRITFEEDGDDNKYNDESGYVRSFLAF